MKAYNIHHTLLLHLVNTQHPGSHSWVACGPTQLGEEEAFTWTIQVEFKLYIYIINKKSLCIQVKL